MPSADYVLARDVRDPPGHLNNTAILQVMQVFRIPLYTNLVVTTRFFVKLDKEKVLDFGQKITQ